MNFLRISFTLSFFGFLFFEPVHAQNLPLGDCSSESQLSSRSGIVFCEPWESETWYDDHGFVNDGGKRPAKPVSDEQLERATLTSDGCRSGKCLKLLAQKGSTRSLSVFWPINSAGIEPQEAYFRYYLKLGPNWTPEQCDSNGDVAGYAAGKFPGLADPRVNDSGNTGETQCGNGGASSDGINCWTARGHFQGCESTGDRGFPYANSCEFVPGAITHIGSYLYYGQQTGSTGSVGIWDMTAYRSNKGDDFSSSCWRSDPYNPDPQCYCNSGNNLYCGIGTGGMLLPNRWYSVEAYVKMNTPGQADGVLRGWVDGVLSYEKTNMEYRFPGHDNLHVRKVWLNVYKGGVSGNCQNGYVYLDQMVVATSGPIGPLDTTMDSVAPGAPTNVQAQ